MEQDGEELKAFIKLWFFAISSISYSYLISARISHGLPRLLSLLPVIVAFLVLPLPISNVHLAFSSFFFLVWLANFKLLLFAFNRGPLSSAPNLPFLIFISTALLPINPKKIKPNNNNKPYVPSHKPLLLAFKTLILAMILHAYHYKHQIPKYAILVLYNFHMYLSMELGFAIAAFVAKILLGFDFKIEPQFNEPYLATSVQDFWGRRWNLMASSILRATVYNPIRALSTRTLGKLRGQMVAIFVTFVVSGIMHELMFFYLMRVTPTWEVSWFFVLHGACTAVEVAVKKKAAGGGFRLHWVVTWPVTGVFMLVTSGWLYMAQPLRNGVDVKFINEYSSLLECLGLNGSEI